jgi:MFS family permease
LPRRRKKAPFFYGWVVIAVAFVTMAVSISARTTFSLLYPELLTEFGWSLSVTAGAYSLGFIVSMATLPFFGILMEKAGPRFVIPLGALLTAGGFVLLTVINDVVGLYIAMGVLIVNGSMATSYVVHSMFLPNWFVRNRGLTIGIAFSGVGAGALILLPLFQYIIDLNGWRTACIYMAILVVIILLPLNIFFQRLTPESMGLLPDGEDQPNDHGNAQQTTGNELILDHAWANTDWTVGRAVCTIRFWAMFTAMFCGLFIWYGIQTHQTKFLIDKGFDPSFAAAALGFTAFCGIFGQIGIGALSDRIGRELSWTISLAGFGAASVLMVLVGKSPSTELVYLAMAVQGLLGYGMSALFGAIVAEVFAGKRSASILALMGLGGNLGGGAGPFVLGAIHDAYGNYEIGFWLCWALSILSILCIWIVGPSRIRMLAREAKSLPRLRHS